MDRFAFNSKLSSESKVVLTSNIDQTCFMQIQAKLAGVVLTIML